MRAQTALLQEQRPSSSSSGLESGPLPPSGLTPRTPVNVRRLSVLLAEHPDKEFVQFVIHGLAEGFDIGYRGARRNIVSPNLPSAAANSDFLTAHLAEACSNGETAGPYDKPPFNPMHCSGLGVVPKKNGKLRPIHHLSAPAGDSVNDGIAPDEYSLHYVTLDDAIALILKHGPGAYLSKVDVKSAFRICPVRRQDWPLLGIHWQGQFYFDRVLPFGLRSSPYIFNSVADAVQWILTHKFSIADLLHYLDDFLNVCGQSWTLATQQLEIIKAAFQYLGIPLAADKVEGPAHVLVFLGIVLDCLALEARLPPDKLAELRTLLSHFSSVKMTTRRSFDSLLGKLSFAARVVVPGRTFMRRLWDVSARHHNSKPHYKIHLTDECRQDLRWWQVLLERWNGKSFFLSSQVTSSHDLGLYTDASGAQGWGAYYHDKRRWIAGEWDEQQQETTIEFKELYAVVAACATWGHLWPRLRVQLHCDNKAVVDCIASGASRAPHLMPLLRCLMMIAAQMNFHVCAVHVPGRHNVIADALSRGRLQVFRRLVPDAHPLPDAVPTFPWVD